jgi:primosomal protein N''
VIDPVPRPRIFVGTLACGEAEREECLAAVAAQTGVSVTHTVIENRPELEAHNALWDAWEAVKAHHDLFVKVDADTVLARPTALAEIAALFTDEVVTGAQILIHDFFTDELIAGLNAFSRAVTFRRATDRLWTDRVDGGHRRVLKGEPVRHLAPIAWHCRSPHPHQAFHFGLHRALKKQEAVIARCAVVWLAERDEARAWALAGAISAGQLRHHVDYGDPQFRAAVRAFSEETDWRDRVERFARQMAAGGHGAASQRH